MAGSATIGALRVVLGLDSAAFTDGLNAAQKHLKGVGQSMQRVGATMASVGAGMTVAITGPLIAAGFAASKAATEAADAMGQVEAALTSMGGASGKTKEELAGLADGLMRNSLYDDDDILRSVTANLLTFGNVAGPQFDRAQQAAVDLATRMKMDLQPATLLVGKALNDPIKGLTAMGRAGIQFTASQKDMIKSLVASGNAAAAQDIILKELERQFGGAAAAAQATDPYDKLRDSLNTLSESAGGIINRFLIPMADGAAKLLDGFNDLSPQMQTFAVAGAAIAAALGPALVAIGAVVGAVGTLAAAFATGGVLAGLGAFVVAAAPFIAASVAIGAAIWAFRDDLVPIFQDFQKAVMDAVGPMLPDLLASAKTAFAAMGEAVSAVIKFLGPILAVLAKAFVETIGPPLILMLRVMAAGLTNAFSIIGATLRVFARLLSGDLSGAWNAFGTLIGTIALGIGRVIDAVFPGALKVITDMVNGVKRWFTVDLFKVFEDAKRKVQEVGDAFHNLWDRVVGHSYIPDMVTGVGQWMAKLDGLMVKPALSAVEATRQGFETLQSDVSAIMDRLMTDSERAARQLAADTKTIRDAVAKGLDPTVGAQLEAGVAGENLVGPRADAITPIQIDAPGIIDGLAPVYDDAAEKFGDAFANGIDAALRGDWQGVLQSLLGDIWQNSLKDIGTSLFNAFKGSGGGAGGGFDIASAFSSVMKYLPGFRDGGAFKVGGAGGIDSQMVAFRATPGERVNVSKPGQQWGGGLQVHVTPSKYFDAHVQRGAAPVAARAATESFKASRQTVPMDLARQRRFALGLR